jgi:hypothetical protein
MTTTKIKIKGYTTNGSVRGQCGHLHETEGAAYCCRDRDQRVCAAQGGYSDREVVVVGTDGYLYRDADDHDSWVPRPGGSTCGAERFMS